MPNKINQQETDQHEEQANSSQGMIVHPQELTQHAFGTAWRKKPRDAFDDQNDTEHDYQGFGEHELKDSILTKFYGVFFADKLVLSQVDLFNYSAEVVISSAAKQMIV